MQRIYLDNNATTPLDPEVLQAMLVDLEGGPFNPSSTHWFGRQAQGHLQRARETVASFLQVLPEEIVFTSGGTEGMHLLLQTLSLKGHVLATRIDHSCVYKPLCHLETQGLNVSYIPVDGWGAPRLDAIESQIRPDTQAMLFSTCNSETGVKLDLEALGALSQKRGIPLYLDLVGWVGKEPLTLPSAVQGAALSAHKLHGPKGIGALLCKKPLHSLPGGGQERGKRAGTQNLSGILGLAKALERFQHKAEGISTHLLQLRDHFEKELSRSLPDLLFHGTGPRINNTSNVAFLGVSGETLLLQLDLAGVAASHGSACSSGALEPSRVLLEMGASPKEARSSIRFSFSRMNTFEEVDQALEILVSLVRKIRSI